MTGFSGHTLPGQVGKKSTEKVGKKIPFWRGGRGPKIVQVLEAANGFKNLPSVADLMRILMPNSKWPAPADGGPGPNFVQVLEAASRFNEPLKVYRPRRAKLSGTEARKVARR